MTKSPVVIHSVLKTRVNTQNKPGLLRKLLHRFQEFPFSLPLQLKDKCLKKKVQIVNKDTPPKHLASEQALLFGRA